MAHKKTPEKRFRKTSLSIEIEAYQRAWLYKVGLQAKGKDFERDLGEIVSEALDEYLKKRGA